jgi:hypothetical protein
MVEFHGGNRKRDAARRVAGLILLGAVIFDEYPKDSKTSKTKC